MSRWMMLALFTLAVPALADKPGGGPPGGGRRGELTPADEKAVHDFKLSTSTIDKLLDAGSKLEVAVAKDPSMQKESSMGGKRSIDENVTVMQSHPEAVAILKSAGLSPKEFLVGTLALMTAASWASMKKQYPETQAQAPAPAYVNPDNLKFVENHPEVMQKIQAAFREKRQHPRRETGSGAEGNEHDGKHGDKDKDK